MSSRIHIPSKSANATFIAARRGSVRQQRPAAAVFDRLATGRAHDFGQVQVYHSAPPIVQTKLTVNQPGDEYEQEADRVADEVMRMPEPAKPEDADFFERAPGPTIQRKCAKCEEEELRRQPLEEDEEELFLTKELRGRTPVVTPQVQAQVTALRGRGEPLSESQRAFFEPRFGVDFSSVRVHHSAQDNELARGLNARAFTFGQDIVFGPGQYEAGASQDRWLLAHELTHVVQQSKSPTSSDPLTAENLQRANQPQIMRAQIFTSTLEICHQYLKSRTFRVTEGGLRVTVNAHWGAEQEGAPMPHGCRSDRSYSIELRDEGLILDEPWRTCDFAAGEPSSRQWTDLPAGDYYLGINTPDTGPYCCLRGDIEVFQESNLSGDTCTEPPPGPLEIFHNALDVAGLIPALGAVPDAINAGIYTIEGDWTNAGISAAAIIPIIGQGATIGKMGTRTVVRITGEGVERGGRQDLAARLRAATNLLRTMRVPRAVPFRGTVARLDSELVRLARDVRATQAGVSPQAFRRYNVATARIRVDGEIRYLDSGNLPSGPHSEEWLHTQIRKMRRTHDDVVLEQLYSERIPCRGTCGPLLSREYPNAQIFYTTRAESAAGRASELMEQYGLAGS